MARSWIGASLRAAWAGRPAQQPIGEMLGGMRGGGGPGSPLTCATRSVSARSRALFAIVQGDLVGMRGRSSGEWMGR